MLYVFLTVLLLNGLQAALTSLAHKWNEQCSSHTCNLCLQEEEPADLMRLIVNFKLPNISAFDVIPSILHSFTNLTKLETSALQILDFIDEDVLQEARRYLKDYSGEIV